MIETKALTKKFGKLVALNNVSVTLRPGETISLVGPNGSGKTTFIKCLLGLVVPSKGQIFFQGKDIKDKSEYRNTIGYMPQINHFPENLRIEQLFDMVRDIRQHANRNEDHDLFESFGLDEMKEKPLRTLSGGTRQKVNAALAFLFDPPVIILDEPTAGLDPLASEELKEKIRAERNKGKLILLTSHILSDLDEITSEIIYLQDGAVQFHETLEQLRKNTRQENLAKAIAEIMRNNLQTNKLLHA